MKTKTKATLRILRRPDLAPGAARYDVDCKFSTTGITHSPRPLALVDAALITAVAIEHEERCGDCDLTERLWPLVQAEMVMRGRRN